MIKTFLLFCLLASAPQQAFAKAYKLSEAGGAGSDSRSAGANNCTSNSQCSGTNICSNGECKDICLVRTCPKTLPSCSGSRNGSVVSFVCKCTQNPDSCAGGQKCNGTSCTICPKGDDCGCFKEGLTSSGKGSCGDLDCDKFDGSTGKCTACRDGFYLTRNKTCAKCSSVVKGCQTCTANANGENVVCKSCKYTEDEDTGKGTHYTLVGQGTDAECIACSGGSGIANCSVCSQTEFNCLTCKSGYSLYQNACTTLSAISGNILQINKNLAPKSVCVPTCTSTCASSGKRCHSKYKICINCAFGTKCNCPSGQWADGKGGCFSKEAVQYLCKNGSTEVQKYYTSPSKSATNGCPKCPEGTIDYVTHYVENGATAECALADGGLGTAIALTCTSTNDWSAFCCRVGRKICKKDGSACTEVSPKGCVSSSNVPVDSCPISL